MIEKDVSYTLGTSQDQTMFQPDGEHYVVRRLMPVECERLQAFPSVVELEPEKMTTDEMIACSLANGDILCDVEAGKVYGTRGPGGMRLSNPRELGFKHPNGYIYVSISCTGVKKQARAHRIIYIAAHGGIPEGMVIDHINGVKDDNRIANLQALTPEDNSRKAKLDGAYEGNSDPSRNKRMIPYEIRREIAYQNMVEGISYKDLAIRYGVSKSTVGNIVHEYGWTDITGCDVDAVTDKVASALGYDEKQKTALRRRVRKWSDETPDTPRYKAMGNSMTTLVIELLGRRIQAYDELHYDEVGVGRCATE